MATDPTGSPAPAPMTPPPAPVPRAPAPAPRKGSFLEYFFLGQSRPGELIVYRHSGLFYWWPVWLLGFFLAAVTYFGDYRMTVVPAGTLAFKDREVEIEPGKKSVRDVLILLDKANLVERKNKQGDPEIFQPTIFMSPRRSYGTLFVIVLLIVIGITNVPMRGLWSVFVLLVFVMLSIVFAVAGWWEVIFAHLAVLSIHINLAGYLLIALVLVTLWFLNFFVFDRQTYMIFSAGQVRVRLEIGGGETSYDTTGMTVQKQRGDLFRHLILGFGSGDLVIRPVGLANPIEMPNVLRVARVVKQIEKLMKEKIVVTAQEKR